MKIAIFSDTHCGYAFGEERGEDSFLALQECIERSRDADLILIAGDIFDSRIPRQEVFAKTAKILSQTQNIPSNTVFSEAINKKISQISPLSLRGIPIVAIHGTHERRSKFMVNPIQALEHAGLLIHLHCGTVVFNIGSNNISEHTKQEWHREPSEHKSKIAVHGMSGVPERFAKDCLTAWDPKPVPNAVNIFMLHQSVDPYIYSPLDPPSIKLEDLPEGFDLYILGHIHWREKKPFRNSTLLLTGSTVSTSIHKIESTQEKGFYTYNAHNIDFHTLKNQRKIFWYDFEYRPDIKKEIEEKINICSMTNFQTASNMSIENTQHAYNDNIGAANTQHAYNDNISERDNIGAPINFEMGAKINQEQDMQKSLIPIFVARIKGKLPKGIAPPNFNDLEKKYKDKIILNISKKLQSEDFEEKAELLRLFREQKLSPEEHGMKILNDFLSQTNCRIKAEEIFELLVAGNIDELYNLMFEDNITSQTNFNEAGKIQEK